MRNSNRLTIYDLGRLAIAVITFLIICLQKKFTAENLILGSLFLIYSAGVLAVIKRNPKTTSYIKVFVFVDTILISFIFILSSQNSVVNFLYVLQLTGLSVSFGIFEILVAFCCQAGFRILFDLWFLSEAGIKNKLTDLGAVLYFLIVVFLLSQAWRREKKVNEEVVKTLNRKMQLY
ncbi:MAG: hypothetical protein CVV03_11485 [Firmicutes bacterium HGW-Firmicutes-8]|nr:MAG: hypothetical protein CVV03_11485 [Firmicutes bacterium HGW-Firmicutes-8]